MLFSGMFFNIDLVLVLNKAKGKNLLYFGCRSKTKDFLYKDELRKLYVNQNRFSVVHCVPFIRTMGPGRSSGVKNSIFKRSSQEDLCARSNSGRCGHNLEATPG